MHIQRYSEECFSIAFNEQDNFTTAPEKPVISYTVLAGEKITLDFLGVGTFEQFSRLMNAAKLELRNNG